MRAMKTVLYVRSSDRPPSVLKSKGFLRGAHVNGWQVQSATMTEITAAKLKELIGFWKADALVCDCGGLITPPNLQALDRLPAIWISCRPPRGDTKAFTVNDDSAAVAELAAKELLRLGLSHFAFVHFPHSRVWSRDRAEHFGRIVRMHGYDCREFKSDSAADVQGWLNRLNAWMEGLPKPCGVFAANDEVSNHVRGICRARKWKMPGDVALVGVDNDESICESAPPRLSSVLADNEQMGFVAAQRLAERLRNPRLKPVRCTVPPLMVVRRESTRPRRATDASVAKALELIRERACEGLRAHDVVAVMDGARRTAEMRFREATGRSILDEILDVRMARARELLCADSTRSVKVVAQMCGYSSESAFRRVCCARLGPVRGAPSKRAAFPLSSRRVVTPRVMV